MGTPSTFPVLQRFRRMLGAATRSTVAALVVTAAALVGIAGKEAFRAPAYLDSAGIPTIGYGETLGVKMGDVTTPERALVQLLKSADAHAQGIKRCITAPLYQYEFDAYLSLAYNIGVAGFCTPAKPGKPPNLIDLINTQQYAQACDRILAYNRAYNPKTGQREVLRGLTNRREAERRACIGGQP
nr:glycoside hydrolase family protein [uncultured Albidiferax sp.]